MKKIRNREKSAAAARLASRDVGLGDRLASEGDASNDPVLVGQAVRAYRRALARGSADAVTTGIRLGGALTLLCQLRPGAASPGAAVTALRSALGAMSPAVDPVWVPIAHLSLAKALRMLFRENGGRKRLLSAIASYRIAADGFRLARAPRDTADATVNLANALTTLSEVSGDPSGALEAEILYRYAIGRLRGRGARLDRANTWVALGNTLLVLAEMSGDSAFAARALTALGFGRRVLDRDTDPQDWAEAWERTAAVHLVIGEMTGGTGPFERAVAAYRLVLGSGNAAPGSGPWADLKIGLGASLVALGEARGGTGALREAVGELRLAVAARSGDGSALELAVAESHLGNALLAYSEQSADAAAAREAALAFRRALPALAAAGDPFELSKVRTNLANALMATGERNAGAGELQEAVALYRLALSAFPKRRMAAARAAGEMNLGGALAMLGHRTGDAALVNEAIIHLRLALGKRTRELLPAPWAKTALNLANALLSLAGIETDAGRADEAVTIYRTLLKSRSGGGTAVSRAKTIENLGTALALRGEILGEPLSLLAAVKAYGEAEREMPRHRLPWAWARVKLNCGNALATSGKLTRSDAQLRAGIESYRAALEEMHLERDPNAWASAEENLGRALRARASLFPSELSTSDAIGHEERFLRQASLLLWASGNDGEQPVWAERISSGALRLTGLFLESNRTADAFAAAQRASAVQLSVALSVPDGPGGTEEAVRPLRRKWREACETANRLDSELLAATGGAEIRKLLDRRAAEQSRVNRRFKALRRAVRSADIRFPDPVSGAELHAALPEGGAAALLVSGAEGVTAFVISAATGAGTVLCMRLDDFTAADLERLVGLRRTEVRDIDPGGEPWLRAYGRFRGAVDSEGRVATSDIAEWNAAIERVSERVWEAFMGPLDSFLREEAGVAPGSEIVLVPAGLISLLPLHAARRRCGCGWRYFVEDWAVSYAPSPAAWLASRRRARESGRSGRSLLAAAPYGTNPAVSAFRGGQVTELSGKAATVRAVRSAVASANYVSLHCHGSWNAADPMRSALHLAPDENPRGASDKGYLTVRDVRDAGLGSSRLVMLLACESGMIGLRHRHEAVGFPAALIDAGAPGVLASLWMVEQEATAVLAADLLGAHLRPSDPLSPPSALRHAQLGMLRDPTGGETEGPSADGRVQLAGGFGAHRPSGAAAAHPPRLHPSAPYYWAGFTLTGA